MFSKTAILFAAASLVLGAAAATPALANYAYCTENPSAVKCPGNFDVTQESFYTAPRSHQSPYRAATHETRHMAPQHG